MARRSRNRDPYAESFRERHDSLSWEDISSAKLADEIGLKQPLEYKEEEKVKIAPHEAGHAVASWYLEREQIEKFFAELEARSQPQGSGVV